MSGRSKVNKLEYKNYWACLVSSLRIIYARVTTGAMNQSIAELHNIKLFGKPWPTKKPTHNIKRSIFNPITVFLNFIFLSPKTNLYRCRFIKLNFLYNSKLRCKSPFVQYGLFPPSCFYLRKKSYRV